MWLVLHARQSRRIAVGMALVTAVLAAPLAVGARDRRAHRADRGRELLQGGRCRARATLGPVSFSRCVASASDSGYSAPARASRSRAPVDVRRPAQRPHQRERGARPERRPAAASAGRRASKASRAGCARQRPGRRCRARRARRSPARADAAAGRRRGRRSPACATTCTASPHSGRIVQRQRVLHRVARHSFPRRAMPSSSPVPEPARRSTSVRATPPRVRAPRGEHEGAGAPGRACR